MPRKTTINHWKDDVEALLTAINDKKYVEGLESAFEQHGQGDNYFYKWVSLHYKNQYIVKHKPYIDYSFWMELDNQYKTAQELIKSGAVNLPDIPSMTQQEYDYWETLQRDGPDTTVESLEWYKLTNWRRLYELYHNKPKLYNQWKSSGLIPLWAIKQMEDPSYIESTRQKVEEEKLSYKGQAELYLKFLGKKRRFVEQEIDKSKYTKQDYDNVVNKYLK